MKGAPAEGPTQRDWLVHISMITDRDAPDNYCAVQSTEKQPRAVWIAGAVRVANSIGSKTGARRKIRRVRGLEREGGGRGRKRGEREERTGGSGVREEEGRRGVGWD